MSDTLSLFQANQSLFSLLNDGNREAANTNMVVSNHFHSVKVLRGRRGRDPIVVGFTTTKAIGAYHH
jgi:hypothetical protein